MAGGLGEVWASVGLNLAPLEAGIKAALVMVKGLDTAITATMGKMGTQVGGAGSALASSQAAMTGLGVTASGLLVPSMANVADVADDAAVAVAKSGAAATAGGAAIAGMGKKSGVAARQVLNMSKANRSLATDFSRTVTPAVQGVGGPIAGFIGQLTSIPGLALLATGALTLFSAKMAVDFDTSMRKVWALTKESEDSFRSWSSTVLDMSTRVPQSANELADSLYWVTSNMPDATDTERFETLEVAARGAFGGVADLQTATRALTQAQNAYDDTDAEHVMDVFTQSVIRGSLTLQDLAANQGKYAGSAALANISIEETSAAMSTLTRNAIPADTAAMALNQTIMSFLKPGAQARETAKKYGIELSLTALRAKGLAGSLMEIAEKVPDDELGRIFPNIRALKAALPLTGIAAQEFAKDLSRVQNAAGTTDEMFNRMSQSISGQFQRRSAPAPSKSPVL